MENLSTHLLGEPHYSRNTEVEEEEEEEEEMEEDEKDGVAEDKEEVKGKIKDTRKIWI